MARHVMTCHVLATNAVRSQAMVRKFAMTHLYQGRLRRGGFLAVALTCAVMSAAVTGVRAQDAAQPTATAPTVAPVTAPAPIQDWPAGTTALQPPADGSAAGGSNTTTVTRSGADDTATGDGSTIPLHLVALLTADGQRIDRDIVWRVFSQADEQNGKSKLVNTLRAPSPIVRLPAGDYLINAAFGRANVTRKISLKPDPASSATERFVLNAGGLRVAARVPETAAPSSAITFSIYSDRDQTGDRRLIIAGVKPGLIVRLNAGIYHIVSTVGDANAIVDSDVTVEAGKLSEASVTHAAAKATFKLVARPGGEALAGTQWTIKTAEGVTIKESTGALPTHVLAPGTYTAVARAQGKTLERPFTVIDGQATQVEVLLQ